MRKQFNVNNIIKKDPDERRFERYVFADNGIRREDLPRFNAYIKKRAQLLLEEIDNWLSQLDQPDPDKEEPVKTGLGIYHFVDEEIEHEKENK